MPPRALPKCIECQKTESMLWRNQDQGQICQECFEKKEQLSEAAEQKAKDDKDQKPVKESQRDTNSNNTTTTGEQKSSGSINATPAIGDEKKLRKSTRATRFKNRTAAAASNNANGTPNGNSATAGTVPPNANSGGKAQNKGRNRRNLFKKTPFKTPVAQATTHSVESLFHKDSYLQVGDIVSVVDNDHNVYYAQIRGLLVDNYCEKSAFLTWLIPTQASPDPQEGFDPATYLIGPDEELSRKLSCLEFIMHAPSNYYLDRTTPFPLPDTMEYDPKPGGYIWTTLPEYHRKKVTC